MRKLINSVATTAALAALMVCLWQDYSPLVTLKRTLIAYVVFYVVGAVLGLVFRSGIEEEWRQEADRHEIEQRRKREETQQTLMN